MLTTNEGVMGIGGSGSGRVTSTNMINEDRESIEWINGDMIGVGTPASRWLRTNFSSHE